MRTVVPTISRIRQRAQRGRSDLDARDNLAMSRYSGSTQQSHWLLGASTLASRRGLIPDSPSATSFTPSEEAILRRHHERRILRFASRMRLPETFGATAIAYFKRFFLDRSVLEHNPAVIALGSLYAASKVEEVIIPADELVKSFDTVVNGVESPGEGLVSSVDGTATCVPVDILLRDELPFLNLLRFHLVCFHPYRSLSVIRRTLHAAESLPLLTEAASPTAEDSSSAPAAEGAEKPSGKRPTSLLDRLLSHASHLITRRALLTDLQFLETHAAIALAAVLHALCDLHANAASSADFLPISAPAVEATLQSGLDDGARASVARARAVLQDTREGGLASDADVKKLEMRRREVGNMANDPTSAVFEEARLREEDAKEVERQEELKELRVAKKAKIDALLGQA